MIEKLEHDPDFLKYMCSIFFWNFEPVSVNQSLTGDMFVENNRAVHCSCIGKSNIRWAVINAYKSSSPSTGYNNELQINDALNSEFLPSFYSKGKE